MGKVFTSKCFGTGPSSYEKRICRAAVLQRLINTGLVNPKFTHYDTFNPLNAELNLICHLLALLGAHHILHVSRIRVKYSLPPYKRS
jgi:hypothetical protein